MIGIGPWESDWGFFNLVLSDTNGYPYSTHVRKVSNNKDYVDFFTNVADSGVPWQNPKPTSDQEGAFPIYVAEWLREQIENAEITFSATNDWQDTLISTKL